jgi:K+ transporter
MKTLGVGFAILAVLSLYFVLGGVYPNFVEILLGPVTIIALLGPVKIIRFAFSGQQMGMITLGSCLLAVMGVAASPLLRGRTKIIVAIVGLCAWAFCEILVASAGI